jgi:hypothetical protein
MHLSIYNPGIPTCPNSPSEDPSPSRDTGRLERFLRLWLPLESRPLNPVVLAPSRNLKPILDVETPGLNIQRLSDLSVSTGSRLNRPILVRPDAHVRERARSTGAREVAHTLSADSK